VSLSALPVAEVLDGVEMRGLVVVVGVIWTELALVLAKEEEAGGGGGATMCATHQEQPHSQKCANNEVHF
jgi:hypothetical protein